MYFASIRRGIIKELYGIYKVFLLLNEYGEPPFLFQNLGSLNKPVGEVWLKIYVQFYFREMILIAISTMSILHRILINPMWH